MKVNGKYQKNVNAAMRGCKDTIITNVIAVLKDCLKAEDHIEVSFKNAVIYHEARKTRGEMSYTPRIAERLSASGLNGDRKQMIIVVEGTDTFCPLEWMPVTTLHRVFETLLETVKAE